MSVGWCWAWRNFAVYIPRTAHLSHLYSFPPLNSRHTHHPTPQYHPRSKVELFSICQAFGNARNTYRHIMSPIKVAGHPVTVSSSSTGPLPSQQASARPTQTTFCQQQGQMMYDDGSGRRIIDSRRRSRKLSGTRISAKTARAESNTSTSKVRPCFESPSVPEEQKQPVLRARSDTVQAPHVTFVKQSRSSPSKPKAVIIVDQSTRNLSRTTQVQISPRSRFEFTPPPSPRLGRLETPELSDLEDTPFCECGADAHIVKRCTRCGHEIES